MFSLSQLNGMLLCVADDRSLTNEVRMQLIRALQNLIAQAYLNQYLGEMFYESESDRGII